MEGEDLIEQSSNNWFYKKKGPCIKVPREVMEASKEEFRSMIGGKFIDFRDLTWKKYRNRLTHGS